MKHPVTTTFSKDELDKINLAKGHLSLFKFMHDATIEKCEGCLNESRQLDKIKRVDRAENPVVEKRLQINSGRTEAAQTEGWFW